MYLAKFEQRPGKPLTVVLSNLRTGSIVEFCDPNWVSGPQLDRKKILDQLGFQVPSEYDAANALFDYADLNLPPHLGPQAEPRHRALVGVSGFFPTKIPPNCVYVERTPDRSTESVFIPKGDSADDVWEKVGGWLDPQTKHREVGYGPIRRLHAGLLSFGQRGFDSNELKLDGSQFEMHSERGVWSRRQWTVSGRLDGWYLKQPKFVVHSKRASEDSTEFGGPGLTSLLDVMPGFMLTVIAMRVMGRHLDVAHDQAEVMKRELQQNGIFFEESIPLRPPSNDFDFYEVAKFSIPEKDVMMTYSDNDFGQPWINVLRSEQRMSFSDPEVLQLLEPFRDLGVRYVQQLSRDTEINLTRANL